MRLSQGDLCSDTTLLPFRGVVKEKGRCRNGGSQWYGALRNLIGRPGHDECKLGPRPWCQASGIICWQKKEEDVTKEIK